MNYCKTNIINFALTELINKKHNVENNKGKA